ncbi:copper resistance CopC family protein [Microbacterium rhizosphaerae]|uniref:Copper resistance protein CopC n=1 Tax=Microbacterium rhizosphaerae TaxID=1678237 RepID=A0ABZ0SK58_9MICO|nr:copper resistance protein CopC [Microbacterium rhizosphaerae]WPR88550.1 copper resistance protein CopC [Microbacterium rhizosphaerae]
MRRGAAGRGILLGLAGVAIALAGVFATASAASAHDSLLVTEPAQGSTTAGPITQLTLTFSGDPIGGQGADVVELVGPDGKYYETGCAQLSGPEVTVPVAMGPAGTYEVAWRAVSSDGHPVSGTYTFTYAPDAAVSASPKAAGSTHPACGTAPAQSSHSDAASSPPPDAGVWLGIGIGLVVVAIAAVGAWLIVRRPKPED